MTPDSLYCYSGTVMRVIDGDTYEVDVDLGFSTFAKGRRLRLLGINCPEMHGPSRAAGIAARDAASSMVLGKSILFRSVELDAFGRILGDVWVDGKHLAEELIAGGFGKVF